MLGMAREQLEGVGQNGQDSTEGADGSGGAAGEVQDQAGSQSAAEGAAQNGQRCLATAFGAHQLRNAVEQAFADSAGGLGSDVAAADAGASGGHDEADGGSGLAQCVLNGCWLVWYDDAQRHRKSVCFERAGDSGTGQVLTRSL